MGVYFKYLGLALVLGVAGGCTTTRTSDSGCAGTDREAVGYDEGFRGWTSSGTQVSEQICDRSRNRADAKIQGVGYLSGLDEYCTEEHGFKLGRSGQNYNRVCPDELQPAFLRAYQRGRERHNMIANINRLHSKIRINYDLIYKLRGEIQIKEEFLQSGAASVTDESRVTLEIDQFQRDIGKLAAKIIDSERKILALKIKYNQKFDETELARVAR